MKVRWSHLDKWRRHDLREFSSPEGSTFGAFSIPHEGQLLNVIASDGRMDAEGKLPDVGWEHVSVHAFDPVFRRQKIPNWMQMSYIKSLFWEESEVVMQLHVAASDHINVHDCVLHLWRPKATPIPLPPKMCV